MVKQKVVPIGRKVLIKPKEVTDEHIAEIIAVGDSVEGLSVGDVVKYSEHADGIDMKHDGDNVLLMNYDMIFAKIIDG